ncbi:hypothetical protein RQN30_00315 [Arcanobacterium hippocoleae]
MFYICAKLGAQVPGGLIKLSEVAAEFAVPLVLISEESELRRGDLPRFGLAGSYDLFPADTSRGTFHTFNFAADNNDSVKRNDFSFKYAHTLRETVNRCVNTWGW